jgi:hypothetical protein
MATKAELTTESASTATEHTEEAQLVNTDISLDIVATEHNAHHTHLAAVILDEARTASMRCKREWGEWTYPAARTETLFNNLKQDVIDVTFVPVTRCALAKASARPPRKKPRAGGIWPTSIESISRYVAAYHRAVNATEHGECEGIVDNICSYVQTLCARTDVPDQLVKYLHQWIENRSINMALRLSLERCLEGRACWKYIKEEERSQLADIVEMALEIVRVNGDELRRCMDNLRNTVN